SFRFFFFSSRRRHTSFSRDWSSDVCSSDLSLSLREQLKCKVEVIELVPPGVQTDLTPGQSTREGYMPLDDFMEEVMEAFHREPTPQEILVERVEFLRWAERDGHFDRALEMLAPI